MELNVNTNKENRSQINRWNWLVLMFQLFPILFASPIDWLKYSLPEAL